MIGQFVQIVKDNLPHERRRRGWHNLSMGRKALTPAEFETLFIARVKALREEKGWTAAEMAMALGIPAERYRKYESRSPLPHALLERFALIVGVPVEFLITGRRVGNRAYPDVPGPESIVDRRAAKLADAEEQSKKREKRKVA